MLRPNRGRAAVSVAEVMPEIQSWLGWILAIKITEELDLGFPE